LAKKNIAKKSEKKMRQKAVIVIESRIAAKDTLFPEKVAMANKILKNTKFHDPSLRL
jgi:hypothetical protein